MTELRAALALLSGEFIKADYLLARAVGLHEAIFVGEIAFWQLKSDDDEGWCYRTQVEIEHSCCLTESQQDRCRERLRDLKILEEKRRGMPARIHYRISPEVLLEHINDRFQFGESRYQVRGKRLTSSGFPTNKLEENTEHLKEEISYRAIRESREAQAPTPPAANENSGAPMEFENLKSRIRAETRSRAKPKALIPENWVCSEYSQSYAEVRGFTKPEVGWMMVKFTRHHLGKGTKLADFNPAFQTWVDNELTYQAEREQKNAPVERTKHPVW